MGKGNVFDNNGGDGLSIESHGDVILSNFSANGNTVKGTYIRNAYLGYDEKNVKINNTLGNTFNTLNDNGLAGIDIRSFRTVTVDKIQASSNANLYMIDNTGASAYKKVTVTNSIFNDADNHRGLYITAYGPVSINNVWASGNASDGIRIENTTAPGQDVTINGLHVDENSGRGLIIYSAGFISVNNASAKGNTDAGLNLQNENGLEGIIVTNSHTEDNLGTGIALYTNGAAVIKSSSSMNNLDYGIFISGNYSSNVTLDKVNTLWNVNGGIRLSNVADVTISLSNSLYNGNSSTNLDGLYITGNGTSIITILKSTFMGNYGDGAELINIGSYTLTSSLFFANDVDGSGDANLYVH